MKSELSRNDLLALSPAVYLQQGFYQPDGVLQPEFYSIYATAAMTQFEAAQVDPKELQVTLEAFQQVLPLHIGTPAERYQAAVAEALETIILMMGGGENHPAIVKWLAQFEVAMHTEADLVAFVEHFLAVVRQYILVLAIKQTGNPHER